MKRPNGTKIRRVVSLLVAATLAVLGTSCETARDARLEKRWTAKVFRDTPHVKKAAELTILFGAPSCELSACTWRRQVSHFSGSISVSGDSPPIEISRCDGVVVRCSLVGERDLVRECEVEIDAHVSRRKRWPRPQTRPVGGLFSRTLCR